MLTILLLTDHGARPDWFAIPDGIGDSQYVLETPPAGPRERQLLRWLRDHDPALMAFAFDANDGDERHLLNRELDHVLLKIRCPVALFNPGREFRVDEGRNVRSMVHFTRDASSLFAVEAAVQLNPNVDLTVVATGPAPMDEDDRAAREAQFRHSLGELAENPRIKTQLLLGDDAGDRLLDEARKHDRVLFSMGRGDTVLRALLGERMAMTFDPLAKRIVTETPVQYVLVREYQGWLGSNLSLALSRGGTLLPPVTREERVDIYKEIRRAARPRTDYFMMIGLSASIASLGLMLDSAAVIIGAMLIAPLMSAIIGMGMAIVQGDTRFLLTSSGAMLKGTLAAIGVGVLMGLLNLQDVVTGEMLGRTGPAILDLGVAVLSGAAAAYALCRKDMSASLPGVAIAVALVPPLATVGLFISLGDLAHAYGALLLFLTNLAAIAFASGIIFTLVGFRPAGSAHENPHRVLAFRRAFLAIGLLTLVVFTQLTVRSVGDLTEESFGNRVHAAVDDYVRNIPGGETYLTDVTIAENSDDLLHVILAAASTWDVGQADFSKITTRLRPLTEKPIKVSLIVTPMASVVEPGSKEP